jgi:hypothetical protein
MKKLKQQYPRSTVLFSCVIVSGLFSPHVTADDVSHGEMASAIRSANYPCAQVLNVDSNSDNAWIVQCNSGKFNVTRDQNGDFKVTQVE